MSKIIALFFIFLLIGGFPLISAHDEEETDYDDHHEGMMSGYYGYGMWGMGVFGGVTMILIIIVLILLIIWLIRELQIKDKRRHKK